MTIMLYNYKLFFHPQQCASMLIGVFCGEQERPHSAMEHQLCALDSGRPRMSVEEQLERIRRHQQGALREKKKGVRIRGSSEENVLSRSNSFTKDNHSRNVQVRYRNEHSGSMFGSFFFFFFL